MVANERDSPFTFPFRERTFIIYCSDGFCTMTGFSRGEVVQRSAVCDFLHGPLTSPCAVLSIREAFKHYLEQHFEVVYYRKDGQHPSEQGARGGAATGISPLSSLVCRDQIPLFGDHRAGPGRGGGHHAVHHQLRRADAGAAAAARDGPGPPESM